MAPRGHSPVCKLATYNYHTSRLQLPLQHFERTLRGWIRMRHPADGFKRNFSRNWRGRGEERRRWWKRVRVVLTSFVSRGKMRKVEGGEGTRYRNWIAKKVVSFERVPKELSQVRRFDKIYAHIYV